MAKRDRYEDYMCPITLEIMKDPVVASDGNTYEREAIERYLRISNLSPMTRQPITHTLFPNRSLKNCIENYNSEFFKKDDTNMKSNSRKMQYDPVKLLVCYEDTREPVTSDCVDVDFNGYRYTGKMKKGVPEGLGVVTSANGNNYRGEFKAGKFEGHGVKT